MKKLLFPALALLPFTALTAQIKIENVPDSQGKVTRHSNTLQFLQTFHVLPGEKASSLARTADKVMDVICRSPHLNPPVGFNARVNISASDLGLKENIPQLTIFCYLRYLTRDSRYPNIKESMDGADLYLNINAFNFFHQMGNYWEDCSRLKFPLFFEQPPLTDSTDDYIEFQYKGDPLRIVKAGSEPVFVPLKRKEFIRFLILKGEQAIKDDKEALKISRDGEEQIRKMMVAQNEKDKAYSISTLKSMDYAIEERQKNITRIEKEISDCRALLNTMTQQDADSPVRLDYNKKGGATGMGSISRLVPVGRSEGVALVKVNTGLYSQAAGAPAAQMITLYYAWPQVGFAKDPDYLQQAMLDIFNHMDYHALKMSMQ